MTSVLFYVQHLMGVGHLKRTALLARETTRLGLKTTLVSGGFPVPGVEPEGVHFEQLPPVRATDETFSGLETESGEPPSESWWNNRRETLLRIYLRAAPDALVVETFPFGRRAFREELIPLLDHARAIHPRPRIFCSMRDILVRRSNPQRYEEMRDHALRYFDRVFLHSDPDLIPFDKTFPLTSDLSPLLHYTGFVAPGNEISSDISSDISSGEDSMEGLVESPENHPVGAAESVGVLVAAGSREQGEPLLKTAMAARAFCRSDSLPWRILAGINLSEKKLREFQQAAPEGVVVEAFRSDYLQLLQQAAVSISQAGYNTTMEVLKAGIPAVFCPHSTEQDEEQWLRASILAEKKRAVVLSPGDLNPRALAEAVDRVSAINLAGLSTINFNGAEETARFILAAINQEAK